MKRLFILFISVFLITNAAYMQTSISKAQSLYIYNFSRMIEWPASYRTGDFIIGILGSSDVATELEAYTKGKKVGNQNIVIMKYKLPAEIQQCHILFIPFIKTKLMPEVISVVGNKSTLIIAEKSGALNEGAAINFIILDDKMKFEVKTENATKLGLKLSAKLTEMSSGSAMAY
jgi:hypothetical protein